MSNQHEMIRDLFMEIREEGEELSAEDVFEDLKRRIVMCKENIEPRKQKYCLSPNEYFYLKKLYPNLDDLLNFEICEPVEISPFEETTPLEEIIPQRYSMPKGIRQKPKKDRTATKKKYRFKKKKKR